MSQIETFGPACPGRWHPMIEQLDWRCSILVLQGLGLVSDNGTTIPSLGHSGAAECNAAAILLLESCPVRQPSLCIREPCRYDCDYSPACRVASPRSPVMRTHAVDAVFIWTHGCFINFADVQLLRVLSYNVRFSRSTSERCGDTNVLPCCHVSLAFIRTFYMSPGPHIATSYIYLGQPHPGFYMSSHNSRICRKS